MKLTVRATSRSLYDEAVAEYDTETGELSLSMNDMTSYVCGPKPPQSAASEGDSSRPFAVGDRVVLLSTAAWVDPVLGIVSSWDGGAVYVRWDGSERPSRDVPDNIRRADPPAEPEPFRVGDMVECTRGDWGAGPIVNGPSADGVSLGAWEVDFPKGGAPLWMQPCYLRRAPADDDAEGGER